MTWPAQWGERLRWLCDHKTVAHWVEQRDLGLVPMAERKRSVMAADYRHKIDGLVDRSSGKIRVDVAHGKLGDLGYLGAPRTTRRWVTLFSIWKRGSLQPTWASRMPGILISRSRMLAWKASMR